jgi:hypothetical protein
MKATFKRLAAFMAIAKTNELVLGRDTKYGIPDVAGKGMISVLMDKGVQLEEDEMAARMDEDDVELEDDGSLDV